jgi:isopentenyl-diphosphate delta-isomerase
MKYFLSSRKIFNKLSIKHFSTNYSEISQKFHPSQTKTFEEALILVDENDNQVSSISKLNGHLKSENNKHPHRAFSVFLFNHKNELLLQKRSEKKITFPDLWSNTCCSHPLNNNEEKNIINNEGIKLAAVRRMNYELGLKTKASDYFVYEKILYRADSDKIFEEYEMDYILLAKNMDKNFNHKEVIRSINLNEVSDIMFVNKKDLKICLDHNCIKVTPWFDLIIKHKINEIFQQVENLTIKEDSNIKTVKYI